MPSRTARLNPGPLGDYAMKPDAFSTTILPRWMRISTVGLLVSLAAGGIGYAIGVFATGTTPLQMTVRLMGAALRGLSIGFGLLFLLLLAAGFIYHLLARVASR